MQYILLIYEDERVYGVDKNGSAIQEIVAKHMAFSQEWDPQGSEERGLEQLAPLQPFAPAREPRRCTMDRLPRPKSNSEAIIWSMFRI